MQQIDWVLVNISLYGLQSEEELNLGRGGEGDKHIVGLYTDN